MKTLTPEMQATITPERALDLLREGNLRFINNLRVNRNLLQQANETRDGQWPFATIVSCIDSRTSAELIFDQGLGDIFCVRIAGNVINTDVIGSLEFACQIAGSKLVVVLGHTVLRRHQGRLRSRRAGQPHRAAVEDPAGGLRGEPDPRPGEAQLAQRRRSSRTSPS